MVDPIFVSEGVDLIRRERERQVLEERYDRNHDHDHADQLALAGAAYAIPQEKLKHRMSGTIGKLTVDIHVPIRGVLWPWADKYWKPKDRIRDLVRSGALIAAAIDSELEQQRNNAIDKQIKDARRSKEASNGG